MGDELAISTTGLTKRYPGGAAVSDLELRVRTGDVHGFLGPNGAGKTTTMRMLVGLVRPTSGSATVLGHAAGSRAAMAGVGALIESPALYPHLSGRDNLLLLARYAGVSAARVDTVLDEVEMTGRATDAFRSYSLGMKQRIGVAAALLKDPELLILDEPTNGLDPAGMADMRALVRGLRGSGRTVLLSSHLLAEVEHLCDRVTVIQRGRMVAEGTVAELRAAGAGGRLVLRVDDVSRAVAVLDTLPAVGAVRVVEDELHVEAAAEAAGAVNRALVTAGVDVLELRPVRASLEDVFFALTAGEAGEPEPSEANAR